MRIRSGIGRMTTQMLSNSRKRAGLSAGRSPLLRSSRYGGTGSASRLGAMNASSMQNPRMARLNYEKLQKSAVSLVDGMTLLAEKADGLTEEQNPADVTGTVENMVEDFNTTLKYLQQNSSVLNDYYRQSLRELGAGSKAELAEIGITVGSNGTLTLNKEKLEEADREKIKNVLGSQGDFARRIKAVASRVADNAKVNAEAASSQYNSSGGLANSYLSRFNLRG